MASQRARSAGPIFSRFCEVTNTAFGLDIAADNPNSPPLTRAFEARSMDVSARMVPAPHMWDRGQSCRGPDSRQSYHGGGNGWPQ